MGSNKGSKSPNAPCGLLLAVTDIKLKFGPPRSDADLSSHQTGVGSGRIAFSPETRSQSVDSNNVVWLGGDFRDLLALVGNVSLDRPGLWRRSSGLLQYFLELGPTPSSK